MNLLHSVHMWSPAVVNTAVNVLKSIMSSSLAAMVTSPTYNNNTYDVYSHINESNTI